jgi:hypothetical protein
MLISKELKKVKRKLSKDAVHLIWLIDQIQEGNHDEYDICIHHVQNTADAVVEHLKNLMEDNVDG